MAMSIRGLPEDVKARLKDEARRSGRSLNGHVVDILSRHAKSGDPFLQAVKSYAGSFDQADILEARRIERENALDWGMSYDDPSGR